MSFSCYQNNIFILRKINSFLYRFKSINLNNKIINDILCGIKNKNNIFVEIDRFLAIQKAIDFAKDEDIVLIAGKGHEDYQILSDKIIDFNDREITKDLLKERQKKNQ